jgi:hypothetical protein
MTVKFDDLLEAFEFVSADQPMENEAYLCVETGVIHYHSEFGDEEEDPLPDDIEDSAKYIAIPHKNDLDLASEWHCGSLMSSCRMRWMTSMTFSGAAAPTDDSRTCWSIAACCNHGMTMRRRFETKRCASGAKRAGSKYTASKVSSGRMQSHASLKAGHITISYPRIASR